MKRITRVSRIHPLGTRDECLDCNFLAIHPTVVEIFKSGPKWCTDPRCHPYSHAASVAENGVKVVELRP